MANILEQGDSELVQLDYSDLLQIILQTLTEHNIFQLSENRDRLLIDIDTVASQVAILPVQNPLTSINGVRSASVNFTPGFRETFPRQIREIRDILTNLLTSTLGENRSIEEFITSLITPLTAFDRKSDKLGLSFDFNRESPYLQKQKLTLETNRPGSASLLKFHKLEISVQNISQFQQQLQQGLANHIDTIVESETEREDFLDALDRIVADERSDFYRLQRIVDTETLGKLKKEAKIRYLEYIRDNIDPVDIRRIYLEDLIRRLRLIETYINQDRPDSYFDVKYGEAIVNYKELFSHAEVLDALPIIPIVTGNLGESTDQQQGERKFVFGLKLKFGNRVEARGGEPAFDYYINILNPDSKEHQEKWQTDSGFATKVLKVVFLYFFIFASRCNPIDENYSVNSELEYNPIQAFDTFVLPILKADNEENKKGLFRRILQGFDIYSVKTKINSLKELLKSFVDKQAILPTRTYPIQIAVRKGILENDPNRMFQGIFFKEELAVNPKECLRYISINESYIDENALCQMPASIKIEDIRYFYTEERQQFTMEFDIQSINALPVMWIPETCMKIYKYQFSKNKLILFRYNNRRLDEKGGYPSNQAFVYRFTYSLLAFICLKILLDNAENSLFIPMVRLHQGTTQNPSLSEKFMAHLSKVLCHLINEKHQASSQGFRIHNPNSFKIRNGLSSLYSVLPKKFRFSKASDTPKVEKLIIIIVSSLETDARTGSRNRTNRIFNLIGEVVSITRQNDGAIRVEILKTFADNYRHQRLYRNPPVLIDTVNNLYRHGYRHFLYIAQAPYTSNLNITRSEEDDRLYFMSPQLIENLKEGKSDIKIYPVFFDKYYVRKAKSFKSSSFYIQDTTQLTNLAEDPKQQAVVFFNLFNGLTVGKGDDRFYNGVISYTTLLNIYPGVLDDQYIRQNLINDDSILKNDLLQYLTLFHFSRFEKDSSISLKLDPYENMIGEEAFSKLSVFNHMNGRIDFNSLAFLTRVNSVLNAQ